MHAQLGSVAAEPSDFQITVFEWCCCTETGIESLQYFDHCLCKCQSFLLLQWASMNKSERLKCENFHANFIFKIHLSTSVLKKPLDLHLNTAGNQAPSESWQQSRSSWKHHGWRD